MRLAAGMVFLLQLAGGSGVLSLDNDRPFSATLDTRSEEVREARLADQSRLEKGVARRASALANDPANVANYLRLARALEDQGDFEKAIGVLSRALCLNPINAATHHELGNSAYRLQRYKAAAADYERATWYNPRDLQARRRLGDCLYSLGQYDAAAEAYRSLAEQLPNDFSAHYWLGCSLFFADHFEAATKPLTKAAQLRPDDFDANFWSGNVLLRVSRFREATENLQRAVELRPSSEQAKRSLFLAAVGAGQMALAAKTYPWVVGIAAGALNGFYIVALLGVCWFSFRKSKSEYPPLSLSLAWLVVMFEGQAAALFLLGFVPAVSPTSSALVAVLIPTIPVIIAAAFGFARQRWGEPFRWPLRFGSAKVIAGVTALLFVNLLFVGVIQKAIERRSGQPLPVQNTVQLLREPLVAHPVLGWLVIALLVPIVEEIVFRGMLYGALCRWMRASFAIGATALLFAAVHFDVAFFIPLFTIGLLLGWARLRSGSLGLPIVTHCLNNTLAVIVTLSSTTQ